VQSSRSSGKHSDERRKPESHDSPRNEVVIYCSAGEKRAFALLIVLEVLRFAYIFQPCAKRHTNIARQKKANRAYRRKVAEILILPDRMKSLVAFCAVYTLIQIARLCTKKQSKLSSRRFTVARCNINIGNYKVITSSRAVGKRQAQGPRDYRVSCLTFFRVL